MTPFRDPVFVRLWLGNTAAGTATAALPVLLALAVLGRGGSVTLLGLAIAARTVGYVALTPVAGVLADRLPRRRMIQAASMAAATGTFVLAVTVDGASSLVLAAALLAGAGQGSYRPTYQAALADVVAEGQHQAANALSTLGARGSAVLAPAIAAGLTAWIGARPVLAASSALWLIALAAPAMTPPAPTDRPEATVRRTRMFSDFILGVREARRHRWFFPVLAVLATQLATGYAATSVLLPLISRDRFGGTGMLATALTSFTVGALLGALLLAKWHPRHPGLIAMLGLALYAGVPLALAVSTERFPVLAAYVLAGIGVELFNVPWYTAIQREVPPPLRARVSSLDFLVSYGLAPVGIALIGPAAEAVGRTPVLISCAVVCLVGPLVAVTDRRIRNFRRSPPSRLTSPDGDRF
ncbi:MFS transporter [Curtobacterium sp. MCBA15_001]|uniref:MFS transporter n=1 Tax=Curtobacterium sp. MCBA15_001 TaxID=1898731 RepID=UPI0008DE993F|nr:MFS transporter [Curtobacterium sp. MCBA15_001]OIH92604.1 hypothetical protein BIU90_10805 [Curtobacterium sp. MCBA15_001]